MGSSSESEENFTGFSYLKSQNYVIFAENAFSAFLEIDAGEAVAMASTCELPALSVKLHEDWCDAERNLMEFLDFVCLQGQDSAEFCESPCPCAGAPCVYGCESILESGTELTEWCDSGFPLAQGQCFDAAMRLTLPHEREHLVKEVELLLEELVCDVVLVVAEEGEGEGEEEEEKKSNYLLRAISPP